MSRTSSMYVSPNLGPTAPWGQQTSTGVFRPPPAISLNPSATNVPRHEGKTAPPRYSAGGGVDTTGEHGPAPGLVPAPPYPLGTGVPHDRHSEVGSHIDSSPPLRSTSPPFYTQNYYGKVPASLVPANAHGVAGAANGDSGVSAITYPAGRIMKMISYSVHREEDAFLAKKESNRVLEKELLHEQELRRETQRQLEALDEMLQMLHEIREAQSRLGASLGLTL
ncbi:conserved hypothetical protein [Leishmania infantum JPCM5]|uniref:Uncharacterized protein n=1 Tax=Leishmania infantum TaxID=5671 RepID=A4I3F0_LEIIN|nr:conserved hypothetical protein [Leishmania infantum JPCM5]CAM69304.1 conserved hypothetical protein [Leishmania infantum JPCM5]|eukprot:XP_001470112.1 conserved hypothetical protein [Leishmania infantum JPCM5]